MVLVNISEEVAGEVAIGFGAQVTKELIYALYAIHFTATASSR